MTGFAILKATFTGCLLLAEVAQFHPYLVAEQTETKIGERPTAGEWPKQDQNPGLTDETESFGTLPCTS